MKNSGNSEVLLELNILIKKCARSLKKINAKGWYDIKNEYALNYWNSQISTEPQKVFLVWPFSATINIWYQINVKRIRKNSA